ncbi:hypothetical protein ACPV5O_24880 [Vibrio maritimus]|uniref:hypothetical protein n=1 Tax=Vibrio maritimus TaxID=990268 RepID=UPI0040682720
MKKLNLYEDFTLHERILEHYLKYQDIELTAYRYKVSVVLVHQLAQGDTRFFRVHAESAKLKSGNIVITPIGVQKFCSRCGEYYPFDSTFFTYREDDRVSSHCRVCRSESIKGIQSPKVINEPKARLVVVSGNFNLSLKPKRFLWSSETLMRFCNQVPGLIHTHVRIGDQVIDVRRIIN